MPRDSDVKLGQLIQVDWLDLSNEIINIQKAIHHSVGWVYSTDGNELTLITNYSGDFQYGDTHIIHAQNIPWGGVIQIQTLSKKINDNS